MAKPATTREPRALLSYWTHGEGKAKINWGVPGDFNRCVTLLSKYVPEHMVKGLCANMHRKATGDWPGHAKSEGGKPT